MTNLFLKAKHWQMFILLFGIPMLFQFMMMGMMISNVVTKKNPDPMIMFSYIKFFPILMIIVGGSLFGWLWSIAIGLQSKVPGGIKMKVRKFKIFFFIQMIYILCFVTAFGIGMTSLIEAKTEPNLSVIFSFIGIVIPLHLFSMFCMFYCLYFVAKTFKTVELQREVGFSDFAGEFFLIWFNFIGVWIIQPKVNKMIE